MRLHPKIDYHPNPVTGDQIGRIFDIWKANRCISNPCFFISQLQFSNFSFSAKKRDEQNAHYLILVFNSFGTIMVVNNHMKHYVIERQFTEFLYGKKLWIGLCCSNNHIHSFSVYTKIPAHNTHHFFKSWIEDGEE